MLARPLHLISSSPVQRSLKDKERYEFLCDMQDLFRMERHGHVGPWQYSDSESSDDPVRGAGLWEKFIETSEHYYLLSNEISLLQENLDALIGQRSYPVLLTDFGPGSAQAVRSKTLPVMKYFSNVLGYCPVDCCGLFVREASQVVLSQQPEIKIYPFESDYSKDAISLPFVGAKNIGLFLGGTISNIEGHPDEGVPETKIIRQLEKFKNILGSGAEMIIAYDSNQNESSIMKSYMHPMHMEFGRNVMHRVSRDLPISDNFNPEAWRYVPVWHEKNHQLCHTVVAETDMSFWLGQEYFQIPSGRQFILNNSFKYPVSQMKAWMNTAGWEPLDHIQDDLQGMTIQLMRS